MTIRTMEIDNSVKYNSRANRARSAHIAVEKNNIHPMDGSVAQRIDSPTYELFPIIPEDKPKSIYTRKTIRRIKKLKKSIC